MKYGVFVSALDGSAVASGHVMSDIYDAVSFARGLRDLGTGLRTEVYARRTTRSSNVEIASFLSNGGNWWNDAAPEVEALLQMKPHLRSSAQVRS